MVFLFSLSLILTAPGEISTPEANLETAAALFAIGKEKKALNLLEVVSKKGPLWAGRANFLKFAHYTCQGKFSPPKDTTKLSRSRLLFMARKSGVFRFLGKPTQKKHRLLGKLLTTLNMSLCHYSGRLHLADRLLLTEKDKAKRSLWIRWMSAFVKVAPALDYRHYSPQVALRILAQKKLDQLLGTGTFSEAESQALEDYMNKGLTPFPDGYPWRISALLPLSGRYRTFGRQMLLALMAARKRYAGLELTIHNTESSPALARKLLLEKVLLKDRPLAIIGPPDKASLLEILKHTGAVPVLNVSSTLPKKKGALFSAQLARGKRAAALAKTAFTRGARKFAILSPKTGYGKDLATEFKRTISTLRGRVLVDMEYDPKKMPRRFNLKGADAVFVPDAASRVELVARIMAASGYFARTPSKKKKGLLLLSTAEGLSQRTLKNSGRYLKGAIFAPGYFGLKGDPFAAQMATWGVRRVLVQAYETMQFYGLVRIILGKGVTTHRGFALALRKLSAGPGLGPLYNRFGHSTRPARLYEYTKGKITALTAE